MASVAHAITGFGSFELNAELYNALSVVSNVASFIKNKANVIQLSYNLNKLNRTLDSMLEKIDGIVEGRIQVENKEPTLTEDRIREFGANMVSLYRTIEYVYEAAQRVRLTNYSIVGGQISRLKLNGERILDLADWIESALNEDYNKEVFERSATERERGDIYDVPRVM